MARFDARESAIVTLDEEETLETPEGVIHILPVWKWLLR